MLISFVLAIPVYAGSLSDSPLSAHTATKQAQHITLPSELNYEVINLVLEESLWKVRKSRTVNLSTTHLFSLG